MLSDRLAYQLKLRTGEKVDKNLRSLADDLWNSRDLDELQKANGHSGHDVLPLFEIAQFNAPRSQHKSQASNYAAPLKYEQIMNPETIAATMKNEVCQRRTIIGIDLDSIKDRIAEHVGGDFDIGPAKMSARQIKELKRDTRYNHNLTNIDNLSEDGAKKLIDAYYRREMDRFNNGDYRASNPNKFNEDRPRDVNRKIIRGNFNFAQELWDRAKVEHDIDTMRKILIESYNAGKRTDQIVEVECIRTGDKNARHVDISKWAKK